MTGPATPGHQNLTTAPELLKRIYERREVVDADGQVHRLHSEVTPDEGELIASLIVKHGAKRILEVGCAYGLSSLHICRALQSSGGGFHTIIDPGQHSYWRGIGVHHLEQCAYSSFELIEEPSELALPVLLGQGRTFDFAVIDGWHTFDHTLLDFFYVDRLLDVGGIVTIDDLHLPGIRRVARYISNYPNYKVIGGAKQAVFPASGKRRIADAVFRRLAGMLPASYVDMTFSAALFTTDYERGLTSEMIAFQKTARDARESHWFVPF